MVESWKFLLGAAGWIDKDGRGGKMHHHSYRRPGLYVVGIKRWNTGTRTPKRLDEQSVHDLKGRINVRRERREEMG